MKGLLKDNPIAWGLFGVCAVFGLLALTQPLLLGHGVVEGTSVASDEPFSRPDIETPDTDLGKVDRYAAITERPLFNNSRRPIEIVETPAEAEQTAQPAGPIQASVVGVIITEETRIAMVRDVKSKEIHRAAEGDALEGGLAGWTVTKVEPRNVQLQGGGGKSAEVPLEIYALAQKAPPAAKPASNNRRPNVRRNGGNNKPGNQPNNQREQARQAQNNGRRPTATQNGPQEEQINPTELYKRRAEEVRQRIAERRAQLRQEQEAAENSADDDN